MSFYRIFAVFLRQVFLLRRSFGRTFGIFYWPTVELSMWGILTVYLNKASSAPFNFVTVFLGALIFWDFFVRVQQGISTSFLEDVWSRNLANIFATPMRVTELLAGLALASILQAALSLGFMALLSWALFAFDIFQYGLALLPFIGVLYMFGWALGILASALVLRFGPAAEVLAWSLPFLFQPLAAVFYPLAALPSFLQSFSKALPATHIFEGMRAIVLGQQFDWGRFIYALVLAALYLAASVAVFAWVCRIARRKGYLVRFNTESF